MSWVWISWVWVAVFHCLLGVQFYLFMENLLVTWCLLSQFAVVLTLVLQGAAFHLCSQTLFSHPGSPPPLVLPLPGVALHPG